MTCIVALRDGDKLYMGADSCGSNKYDMIDVAIKKIFRKQDMIIGGTGDYRMGQLLEYKFTPPIQPDGMGDIEYMSTLFIDTIKTLYKDNGYSEIKDNREESFGEILVLRKKQIYRIEGCSYSLIVRRGNFDAIGCGDDISLGVLFALDGISMSPQDKIITALKASEKYKIGVCSPFNVEEL